MQARSLLDRKKGRKYHEAYAELTDRIQALITPWESDLLLTKVLGKPPVRAQRLSPC